ncbi:mechanosensitive ion channel domain-containing protein [Methyloversatilis thermotolerans]|uniref:mechanosensitive ion channel domain-containing protein n=1 Tax=Methyloversatilis thermotolerans TaxID=1346290 RepID=UPI001E3FB70B|nr:mechanosensitive ion channel domain-containing protein [Methyloversatilis thermotolerans]
MNIPQDPSLLTKMVVTAVILALAALLTRTARRIAAARFENPAERKQAWVTIRNIALMCGLALIGLTWTLGGDQSSLPLAAVAGASLIVSKDILISALGGGVLFLTRTYQVGDFIEVGGLRGRVADIRFLSTVLDASGDADLITGTRVLLQHSSILTGTLRVTPHEHYVLTTVRLFIGDPVHCLAQRVLLEQAAQEVCAPWVDEAEQALLDLEDVHWSRLPSARPRVFIDLSHEPENLS